MRLTVLGSGTAVPVAGRFPSGVLVEAAGERVLVDAGPGVLRRLPEVGLDLGDITAVLLTHYHVDHSADVAALLFGLRNPRYAGRPPLALRGGPGLHRLLDGFRTAWGRWVEPRDYVLDSQEIGPGPVEWGSTGAAAADSLRTTAVAIDHTDASLAYRFEADGAVFAVSGDARPCPGLAEVARGADVFVCEASAPGSAPLPGHLTPEDAGAAAAAAGVGTLCLTHFYPECDGHDLRAEAQRAFAGEIVLAEDLTRFERGGIRGDRTPPRP